MYSITYVLDGQTVTGTYDNSADYLQATTWLDEVGADIIDGALPPVSQDDGYL